MDVFIHPSIWHRITVMRWMFIYLLLPVMVIAQSTVQSVPNQKLIDGSYVSNPDGILRAATVTEIDTLLSSLERRTSVQVAVVVLSSIGDSDIFDFAQDLFHTWGIGGRASDNGLLVLLVKDQRTIRFHTGLGIEGVLPDARCKQIHRDFMIPEFKNDRYDEGILNGLREVDNILSNPDNRAELEEPEVTVSNYTALIIFLGSFVAPFLLIVFAVKATRGSFSDSKKQGYTSYPEMRQTRMSWLMTYIGVPVLIVSGFSLLPDGDDTFYCFVTLYLYFMATTFYELWRENRVIKRFLNERDYYSIVGFIRSTIFFWLLMALLFPFPLFFYFIYHLTLQRRYRNHPRKCLQCQGRMRKLDEKSEDAFLTESQQMEEKVRSVDYDVWKCDDCNRTEQWNYRSRFTRYTVCPSCKAITFHSVSKKTIQAASYTSAGSGEEVKACKFCNHRVTSTYAIAQLVYSSSSDSSSSDSSGGSWGGGDSGGGGASSSW